MAIRPNFIGINKIEDFKNIFGYDLDNKISKILLNIYADSFDKNSVSEIEYEEDDFITKEEVIKIIDNIVEFGEEYLIKLENQNVDFLLRLILNQPDNVYTGSNEWRYYQFEYFLKIVEKLEGKPKKLINYLNKGRKIFCDEPTDTEFPYAYLSIEEMKIILEDMKKNWEKYDDSENFGKDFKQWMETFINNNKDLFYYNS